jgi:hypothetical protein
MAAAATVPSLPFSHSDSVSFYGDRLRRLLELPEPKSVLPGVLGPEPSLHVFIGRAKTGKTTFALHLASRWCQGDSPWPGAPRLPGTRALVLSAEDTVTDLAWKLRRVQGSGAWADRLHLIADISAHHVSQLGDERLLAGEEQRRRLMCLTPGEFDDRHGLHPGGIDELECFLRGWRDAGDPVGLVVFDALPTLKPPDADENSADDMSAWLKELQSLCRAFDVYGILIHHPSRSNRKDPTDSGRGSTAIQGVARVMLRWDINQKNPRQRTLDVRGNAVVSKHWVFDVCEPADEESAVRFFRPSTSLLDEIGCVMTGENAFSIDSIGYRIARVRDGVPLDGVPLRCPPEGKRPSGPFREAIKAALVEAETRGAVENSEAGWVLVVGAEPREADF